MILPLIILYVVTLVYLAITERFRNFASLIGLQGSVSYTHLTLPTNSRV